METMTMDTLWTEAVRDHDHERLTAALERAEGALASKFAFVSEATSQRAYEDRLAVIASSVEAGVAAATSGDPVLFAVVHQALLTQWEADFHRISTIRRQEAQRRNHRRAYERNAARRSGAYKAIPITNVNDDEWLAFKSPDGFARTYEMPDGSMVVIQGLSAADEFEADNPDAELMQTTHHPAYRDRRAVTRKQAWRYAPGTPQHVIDDFERLDQGLAPFVRSGNDGTEDFSYIDPSAPPAMVSAYQNLMQMAFANGWLQPGATASRRTAVSDYKTRVWQDITGWNWEVYDYRTGTTYGMGRSDSKSGAQQAAEFALPTTMQQTRISAAKSDECPKCGVHMDDVTIKGDTLSARCKSCGWSGSKRKGASKTAGWLMPGEDERIEALIPEQVKERLMPFLQYLIDEGINSRSVKENLMDAIRFVNVPASYNYFVSKMDAATSANPGNWYIDHDKHVYTERLDGTMAAKRPLTGAWIAPFVDQVRTTGVATIGFTGRTGARRAITLVHEGSLIHWAVTDESGEKEDGSGSGKSVRDTLEQAWDLLNTVLDKEPPPTGDVADQAQQAEKAVGEAVDAAGGDSAPVQPEKQDGDSDAPAPAAEGDAKDAPAADAGAKKDKAVEDAGGDEAPQSDAKGDDSKPDFIKDKDDAAGEASPPPPATDDAESGDDGATASAPDSVVDQAEDSSLGDVLGVDPTNMQPGTRTTMTYTLNDGTTGSVEVTFIREDNEIYFFDGPNGEFGLGDRDGEWVDSEGNSFAFSEGDAIEEITGDEDAAPDAALTEIDLDVPVDGGEDVVVEDKDPAADDSSDDEGAGDKPDFAKKDDDDEDEDVKKVKEAMLRENPGMPTAVASRLAARAAALAKVL